MNNRFKFRAWDKINNEWLKYKIPMLDIKTGFLADFFDRKEAFNRRYALEQCTGLKDKNGKLIYNGDIIKSPSNSNVLRVYQEDSGLWRCIEYRVGGRKELPLYQLCDYGVEICGNIHENEELYNG